MANPPPNAEPGRCIASLSQLIFHLHSGLGSSTPQDALDALLTALQGALPCFGAEQRESIHTHLLETLSSEAAPYHPGLRPLGPAQDNRFTLETKGGFSQSLSLYVLHDTLIVEISSDLDGASLAATDLPTSPLRKAPVDVEAIGFQPSLGQCFFLYLQAENRSPATAKAWAKAISGQQDLQVSASATLLGRPLFEFGSRSCVWYVWLDDPHKSILQETDGSYQQHLFNLLCCRAKLETAFCQARQAFSKGYELYQQVEGQARRISLLNGESPEISLEFSDEDQHIAKLKKQLRMLAQFGLQLARCERDLLAHRHTFNINAFNADQACRALLEPEDTFLQKFLKQDDVPTWLQQMDHDAQVLHSGQRHAEQLISALRAIVALDGQELQLRLEQEEKTRDRDRQTTIFFVGAALSISGLAAATRPRPATKVLAALAQPQPHPALLWFADIGVHFVLGIGFAAFLVLLPWWAWRAWRARRQGLSRRLQRR